ncbi:hypothetical protein LOTGIDRAFT_231299 [Lottia gigantea]|uniref:Saposin B-type domain-containing protein n=1 Tax=Lottia gigantea TaxID=225164 RepID=V4AP65_LOTGI|nr:hypothetical protein LOTGIDRAFT_231299 [Lottia gigantea]ESO98982.1 hypothetical protein LOTGIDRAFT_231299 [Lottia gigantea]
MAPLMLLMIVGLASVYGVQSESVLSKEADFFKNLFQPRVAEEKACTDCLKFIGDIKTVMASQPFAAQIASQVDMGCTLVGSVEAQCKQMVTALIHSALTFVSNFANPQITCDMLAFCLPTPPPKQLQW